MTVTNIVINTPVRNTFVCVHLAICCDESHRADGYRPPRTCVSKTRQHPLTLALHLEIVSCPLFPLAPVAKLSVYSCVVTF